VVVTALRGALGFLTRLRVDHSERAWQAFRESPWAFPLAGYVVGALLAVPFVFIDTLPAETVALAYLAAIFAVTGVNHLDGVADVGDALVVHGDSEERTRVLKDTKVGVGAVAAVAVAVVGLALGALGTAGLPTRAAIAVVVAAEVGAKVGIAAVACLGTAAHEGLGSQFTERASARNLLPAILVAVPAVVLSWPTPAAAGALAGAIVTGFVVLRRLESLLDGVNGDVFGAVNEVGRVVGLHLGVVAWTLS
jgi:adenosylcobinamide-GDP ribazoletransferase